MNDTPTLGTPVLDSPGLILRPVKLDISPCTNRAAPLAVRPTVRGKFVFIGAEKFLVRGVTYGAFRPDRGGREYTDHAKLNRDFAQMAACGVNTVRIPHTVPPRALLDIALGYGLRVMVGLSAEQYAGYLIDRKNAPDIGQIMREKVRAIAGHQALLCYAVGNEISAPLVRWIGRKRVEQYIYRVFRIVKEEDPEALVTYVNYPTTEYLDLPFLDLVAFNVYLESRDRLGAYLSRLQNIAGDRPLMMSEIGLDSLRNGEEKQAESLDWQIRMAFAAGCAGTFVFSWTDEWFRAEAEVEDWAFGLTGKDRRPKAALAAVEKIYNELPFPPDMSWPRVSVVVCSYNGAATIRDTMEALQRVDYPDLEVIVVNDGSTDATPDIASNYGVRVISTPNRGLSAARNTGWEEATGEIVAYTDDDAYPDPHWLKYLAYAFQTSSHVAIGGPNVPPPGDGWIAECVANSPGGPLHVLLTDELAEHIPGCNMAIRRSALAAIGGFDARFRAAGDDVDVCWRLQQQGGTIGFQPAALVWHHRRNSIRAYWKQQIGYGRAEALLEEKWPERYNCLGHTTWGGRIYGRGFNMQLWLRQYVYHGVMGSAPFQSLYRREPGTIASILLMPEWYLLVAALALAALLGFAWAPMFWSAPLAFAAIVPVLVNAGVSAHQSMRMSGWAPWSARRARTWLLTTFFHVAQPAVRLWGRLRNGLTPWRQRSPVRPAIPRPWSAAVWTTQWASPETRPEAIEQELSGAGVRVIRGGAYDRHDFSIVGGLLGGARMLMAIEDHGGGAQYIRTRVWPRLGSFAVAGTAVLLLGAAAAAADAAWAAAGILAVGATAITARGLYECGCAIGALRRAVTTLTEQVWCSGSD